MREHFEGKTIPATYVAEIDGKIVGSASIIESDMPERPELKPWLASVFCLTLIIARISGQNRCSENNATCP